MTAGVINRRLTALFEKQDPHLIPVLFYKGRSRLFNRVVSWKTNGRFSHTEVVLKNLNQKTTLPAEFLMGSSSFLDGGVRLKSFDINDDNWELRVVRCKVSTQESFQWFIDHDAEIYSVVGVLGLSIGMPSYENGSSFCNQACGASIGLKEAGRYDPNSFFNFIDLFSTDD